VNARRTYYGPITLLVVVVSAIIIVAFRGSWGAARDAALACHFDKTSADLYPFAVDGLIVVAIISLVLLRHDAGARRYCLGIIGGYTVASWIINYLHGLGWFAIDPATGERPVPPWPVVAVVASLVIGSIFLGSHLLVYVWRHLMPGGQADADQSPADQPVPPVALAVPAVPEPPAVPPTSYEAAKLAYRESLRPDLKTLSQRAMVNRYGVTKRDASRIQAEVKAELDAELDAAGEPEGDDEPEPHTLNGHVSEMVQ
jgi:hypothetical protein